MTLILLLLMLDLLRIAAGDLTPYTEEETEEIKIKQKQQWDSILMDFGEGIQEYSCAVANTASFYLQRRNVPTIVRLRGRAYFMEDPGTGQQHGKLYSYHLLTPFDTSKVFVFSEKGLIVKSQQFYESFAFQFSIKANETYRVQFMDGPPGPIKLIIWELQYKLPQGPSAENITSYFSLLSVRLEDIYQNLRNLQKYQSISNIQNQLAETKFISDNQSYFAYICLQIAIVTIVCWLQVKVVRGLIKDENIV